MTTVNAIAGDIREGRYEDRYRRLKSWGFTPRNIGMILLILFLGFLTLYPLAMLIYGSLHSTPPGMAGEFNLNGYRELLSTHNLI